MNLIKRCEIFIMEKYSDGHHRHFYLLSYNGKARQVTDYDVYIVFLSTIVVHTSKRKSNIKEQRQYEWLIERTVSKMSVYAKEKNQYFHFVRNTTKNLVWIQLETHEVWITWMTAMESIAPLVKWIFVSHLLKSPQYLMINR